MKLHELKAWPEPFFAVVVGAKCFEIRRDDRGFEVGDVVNLREYVPPNSHLPGSPGAYTGREQSVLITYLERSECIPEGWCGFGFVRIGKRGGP